MTTQNYLEQLQNMEETATLIFLDNRTKTMQELTTRKAIKAWYLFCKIVGEKNFNRIDKSQDVCLWQFVKGGSVCFGDSRKLELILTMDYQNFFKDGKTLKYISK